MKNINWLAILVAAIVGMGIGFLWYGALFANQWMLGNGISMEGETMLKDGIEVPMSSLPMILNTIAMIIYALILNWLITISNSTTFVKGALIGLAIGAIACMDRGLGNLFASESITLTWIDGSYILVALALMGGIIGAWRKK